VIVLLGKRFVSCPSREASMMINTHTLEKGILSVYQLLKEKLTIPSYQRPYKWNLFHIQQLFSDIESFKKKSSYRLGKIVFYSDGENKNIVDGQQRTITLILTIHALIELRRKQMKNSCLGKQLDELEHKMPNPQFPSEISKKNLRANYTEIRRIVIHPDFDEEQIHFLLNQCHFVFFSLSQISEAFQFFDSQNARGRELEPHDLLKAYHLREFSEKENHLKSEAIYQWEHCETSKLAEVFSQYLYPIRSWIHGDSASGFGKKDTGLFKGLNIETISTFPYVEPLRIVSHFVDRYNESDERKRDHQKMSFPFCLDQTIINGRRFFEMIEHYLGKAAQISNEKILQYLKAQTPLTGYAERILETIQSYAGRLRDGDKYIRQVFNCSLLYYIDKFGYADISKAIEKIFIWIYYLRLKKKSVTKKGIDNYVIEKNLFKWLRGSTTPHEFLRYPLSRITQVSSTKTEAISNIFEEMSYCERTN
jgi:uncharacterized protein with ParB-like and HNH nuclease domain